MKVNIVEGIDISDEQRVQLAVVTDNGKTKPKRLATRVEIKEFAWRHGVQWDDVLRGLHAAFTTPAEIEDEDLLGDEEDLRGTSSESDLEDLL